MGWWGDGASDSNEEVQAERGGDVHVLQAQGRGRVGEEHGERVLGVHQQVVLLCPARRQALGHLWKLLRQRWLELALALAGWGGRGGLYVLLIEGIDQVWGDCGGGG